MNGSIDIILKWLSIALAKKEREEHFMKKSFVRVAAGASALMMLMAGCGGNSSSTTSSGTNSGSSDTGAASSTGKELTYWSMWNSTEGQAKVIQEAADAFEKETGVHINIEWKGRDIKTLIQPALDAGEKIDFFDQDYLFISKNLNKYVADLTDFVKAADYEKHALPLLLETAKSYTDGVLKVIPYQPYTTGVWYDKDMFEKAGVTEVPETFTELLEVCEKLKQSGVNPMTCDSGDGNALLMGYQLGRYVGQDKVVELVKNGGWANVPEVEKAAQDIYTLFDKGYMSEYAPAQYPNGQNEIGFGESAMVLNASWVPNEIIQNTGTAVNWGFFPWPSVEGGVDGPEASMVGAQGFAIVDKSGNKQEAFDFIMKITTGEYDLKMAEAVSSIPADVENTQWPEAVSGAEPYFKKMTKSYLWAVGLQENPDVKDFIQDNIDKLCRKEIDAKGFAAAMPK